MADKGFLKDLFSIEDEKKQDEKVKSSASGEDKSKTKTLSQKTIIEDKQKIKEAHERKPIEKVGLSEIKFPDTVKVDLSDTLKTFLESTLKHVVDPLLNKLEETQLPPTNNLEHVNIDNLIDETTTEDVKSKKESDSSEFQEFKTYKEFEEYKTYREFHEFKKFKDFKDFQNYKDSQHGSKK